MDVLSGSAVQASARPAEGFLSPSAVPAGVAVTTGVVIPRDGGPIQRRPGQLDPGRRICIRPGCGQPIPPKLSGRGSGRGRRYCSYICHAADGSRRQALRRRRLQGKRFPGYRYHLQRPKARGMTWCGRRLPVDIAWAGTYAAATCGLCRRAWEAENVHVGGTHARGLDRILETAGA